MSQPTPVVESATSHSLSEHDQAFVDILENLDNEEYERAMAAARTFLERHPKSAYKPYASYFKLFAEAYREWQCNYHYTQIRSYFMLGHYLLRQELARAFPAGMPAEHAKLVNALGHLSKMVSFYTRCENSLITNDSFALARNAQICCDEENAGLELLQAYSTDLVLLRRIADWLQEYFDYNRYLHEGFVACGKAYSAIFARSANVEKEVTEQMQAARAAHAELHKRSPELSSELNAHIQHIQAHFLRIRSKEQPVTYLRIASGKLVLSMSAACNATVARKIIDDPKAWDEIAAEFRRRGIVVRDFRNAKLNDIFETSFGRDNLRSLAFDLEEPTGVTFLDERHYSLEMHISLSAFGVCTIYFTLDIPVEEESRTDGGLTVEEARTLESFICPQTGQLRIELPQSLADSSLRVSDNAFPDRLDLAGVVHDLDALSNWLQKRPEAEASKLAGLQKVVRQVQPVLRNEVNGLVSSTRASIMVTGHFTPTLANELLTELQRAAADKTLPAGECAALQRLAQQFYEHCSGHVYLTELAAQHLETVEVAFRSYAQRNKVLTFLNTAGMGPDQIHYVAHRVWHLSTDTGWHAYLNATSIDVVGLDGQVKGKHIGFDQLYKHRDALGLYLEQREARASFDDWRFAQLKEVPQHENMAHIRSHLTDAFFGSEYQAFLYFPDDPQFLVDQYEATVELMIRVDTALKFYNDLSQMLTFNVRNQLEAMDRHAAEVAQGKLLTKKHIILEEQALKNDLEAIWHLRSESHELQNVVCRAGISRYKDHGDLMAKIVEKMSIDKVVRLLDEYLKNLDDLHKQILENLSELKAKVQARTERTRQKLLVLAGAFTTALGVPKIVEAAFKVDRIQSWAKAWHDQGGMSPAGLEGIVTLLAVGASILFLVWRGWPRGEDSVKQAPSVATPE